MAQRRGIVGCVVTRLRFVAWSLVAVLAGCGTSTPVPEDRFYQLEISSPGNMLESPVLSGGLAVERVTADPMRSGRAILYRNTGTPLELRRYHYEFWVDEPPDMIRRSLVAYLGRSGVADAVRDGSQRNSADYSLRAHLQRFEQLVGAGPSGFEVELEITLYSHRSDSVLWTKVYRQKQDADKGDMHTVARAMQSGLASIFHSIVADIQSVPAGP